MPPRRSTPKPHTPVPSAAAGLGVQEDMGYRERVYTVVCAIPAGRVLGYGHVAAILGAPRAARQVGYALAALPPGSLVPWWRVLRSDGTIALRGDPQRGPKQSAQLRAEGIPVHDSQLDMAAHRWPGPELG